MNEIPLVGGDVNIGENVVVRAGDTVRRPLSDRAPAVHTLLRHFEAVGFVGAPRVWGIDERGRETLSFVEGEPALKPVPADDDDVGALGAPLRGIRLRLLCDAYGLAPDERVVLLDVVAHCGRIGYETHRVWGGIERRPGWAEMWDAGSGDEILARNTWFEAVRDDLLAFLR